MTSYVRTPTGLPLEMDYRAGVMFGMIPTQSRAAAYGHTPTATANSDVWEGTSLYPFQFSAVPLEILSSSANDASAGTGARTMMIAGLDGNWNVQSEIITLNGVTPVATAKSYMRINGLNIVTAGSGNVNAGDITLRLSGAGATQAIARAGYGFAKQAIYTVPASNTLLITDLLFAVGGTGNAVGVIYSFCRVNSTGIITITNEYNVNPSQAFERKPVMGGIVAEKTALIMRITAINGSPTGAYAAFEGVLINNGALL
jgi:hypothetical protein